MLAPSIVYEEENFFIVNKPAKYYSHPNYVNHKVHSLVQYYESKMDFPIQTTEKNSPYKSEEVIETEEQEWEEDNEEINKNEKKKPVPLLRKGLVHRLDMETSGLVIMAKNPQALVALQNLFKNREVKKKYQAMVHGHFFEHNKVLIHKLIRDPRHRVLRKVIDGHTPNRLPGARGYHLQKNRKWEQQEKRAENYKVAKTQVTPLAFFKDQTLVDIEIFTGRTHQIRVQLAFEGFPVIGDSLYGAPQQRKHIGFNSSYLLLNAYFLEFTNPFTGQQITQQIELPDFFTTHIRQNCEKYSLNLTKRRKT